MTETAEIPQDSAAPDFSMRDIIDLVAEAEQIREAVGDLDSFSPEFKAKFELYRIPMQHPDYQDWFTYHAYDRRKDYEYGSKYDADFCITVGDIVGDDRPTMFILSPSDRDMSWGSTKMGLDIDKLRQLGREEEPGAHAFHFDSVAEIEAAVAAAYTGVGVVESEQIDEDSMDKAVGEADAAEEAADSVVEADESTAEAKPASMRGLIDLVAEAEVMEDEDVDESITVYAQLYDGYGPDADKYASGNDRISGYLHPSCAGDIAGATMLESLEQGPTPWTLHDFSMLCSGLIGGAGTELDTNTVKNSDGGYKITTTFDSDGTDGKMAEITANIPWTLVDDALAVMKNPIGESAAVTEEAAPAAELKTDPVILVHDALSNLRAAHGIFKGLRDGYGLSGMRMKNIKYADGFLEATAGIMDHLVTLQPEFAKAAEQKDECIGLSVDMFNARKDLERLEGDRIADPSEPRQVIEDVVADMPAAIDAWKRKIESIRDSLGITNTYEHDHPIYYSHP